MLYRNTLVQPAPMLMLLVLVTLTLYWQTVVSLFQTWTDPNDPTYSHGLLLAAISAVLFIRLWRRSPVIELQPSYWGTFLLAVMSFVWLLAHLGYVQTVQQLSLLALIGLLPWVVVGYRSGKRLAFPVLLLLFAMPIWKFLNNYLQYLTAHAVTFMLNNTGFTSILEGRFILVPAGTFEVSTDCSGVSQLIVAMMVAILYSHINELRLKKALLLTAIAMLVAIVSNTVRIYIVVVSGQLTNMRHYFVTEDHWTLGWVLFGIGMFVFLLWANRYVAPEIKVSAKPEQRLLPALLNPYPPSARVVLGMVGLAIGALALGPALAHVYTARDAPVMADSLTIPDRIGAWQVTGAAGDRYHPSFHGADIEYDTLYRGTEGANVYLYVAYYARQEQGKEAVYYLNSVYDGKHWRGVGSGERKVAPGLIHGLRVNETQVQSTEGSAKIVWQWYYVNGFRTNNDYVAKILNVLGVLRGKPGIAVIIIAAPLDDSPDKSRAVLKEFLDNVLEKVERGIDGIQSS